LYFCSSLDCHLMLKCGGCGRYLNIVIQSKRVWRFEDKTERKSEENLVYEGHVVGVVELLRDVGILFNYPSSSTLMANISVGQTKLKRVFSDSWTETF
jgi:hypothetical protein